MLCWQDLALIFPDRSGQKELDLPESKVNGHIQVSFNQPPDAYQLNEDIVISMTPSADYYLHLFAVDDAAIRYFFFILSTCSSSIVHKGEQNGW